MHIYFSGIGGVGIGPLAQIAHDAGYTVSGSDLSESPQTQQLIVQNVDVRIGQDGSQINEVHDTQPIDWFVHTAALTDDHPELVFARSHGIRTSKRDELLAQILKDQNLKLVAVAGTHGKTTTTGMLIWIAKQLGLPASYSVGSTLLFGPSGKLDKDSPFFFYECDEYDRNFLHFEPNLSLITSIDYDHPDTYPIEGEYKDAFTQFLSQSATAIAWQDDLAYITGAQEGGLDAVKDKLAASRLNETYSLDKALYEPLKHITLPGQHVRHNAALAVTAMALLTNIDADSSADWQRLYDAINSFPGTGRRFEKLADNLYSDYGHHPQEIAAMVQMAREISDKIVIVYQPHQNRRQHRIKELYKGVFDGAHHVYWLPTYLSREDSKQEILQPGDLIPFAKGTATIEPADMDEHLWQQISKARSSGNLVLCMGAGSIDGWVRQQLAASKVTSTQ